MMFRHTNPWRNFLEVFALSGSRLDFVSSSNAATSHAAVNDESLTATISARIHDKIGSSGIGVTSTHNLVQLSGSVDTAQISARAERITRETSGVRNVRNRLIVRLPKAEHPTCMQNGS
ncbi:MAG: BON domain-containing protein [Alphaproteobacteria bacterium]|nr:BON domain-containing protein [Alphaproteobacteria bacterium]